ncbi:MAG: ABC transporter ATP-binding protein [Eubacteriales bacterium]
MGVSLEVSNLTKIYHNGRGIKDISFSVNEGDIFGLLGPNGSGKTTTMKIITGLSHSDNGSVQIFGKDVLNDREKALENIGCLIEAPATYDYISAEKNLEIAARYYSNVRAPRIEDILTQTGLFQYRKNKVRDFSLGMKQRLGLALALISDPKLIILDEPLNGLDIEGMVAVRKIIMKQAKSKGVAFLISSHLAHELELTCNKIAVLKMGHLIKSVFMNEAIEQCGTLEKYYLETSGANKDGAL